MRLGEGQTRRQAKMLQCQPRPRPPLDQLTTELLYFCDMWVRLPEQCGWSQGPRQSTLYSWFCPVALPLDTSCLYPSPQSLSVETLGPEPRMDPEPERVPQAPQSPSKTDGGVSAGTLDGEGNRALLRVGCSHLSSMFWGFPVSSGRRRLVSLISHVNLS